MDTYENPVNDQPVETVFKAEENQNEFPDPSPAARKAGTKKRKTRASMEDLSEEDFERVSIKLSREEYLAIQNRIYDSKFALNPEKITTDSIIHSCLQKGLAKEIARVRETYAQRNNLS